MIINHENLVAMFRTYSTSFQDGIGREPPIEYMSWLATEFPSMSASNFYAWMDLIPGFREWVGERVFQNIRANNFEIINRPFECSVRVPNEKIEDDQYGVYSPVVRMQGEGWPTLLWSLVAEVIKNNTTCFTGKAMLATDHAYGDNTIANLSTDALSEATFLAAYLAAAAWQWANGELIRPNFTHLVVGEKNRVTAFNLVQNEYVIAETGVGGMKGNPNRGKAKVVICPDFVGTYDDYWCLVDASKAIHAIALQIRKTPVPLMDTDPATVMRSGQVDFMADGRAAAGPTFPHLIYGGRL